MGKRRLDYTKPGPSSLSNVVNADELDAIETQDTITPLRKVNPINPLNPVIFNKPLYRVFTTDRKKQKEKLPPYPLFMKKFDSVADAQEEINDNTDEESIDMMKDNLKDLKKMRVNLDFLKNINSHINKITRLPSKSLSSIIWQMNNFLLAASKAFVNNENIEFIKNSLIEIIDFFYVVFIAKKYIEDQSSTRKTAFKVSPLEKSNKETLLELMDKNAEKPATPPDLNTRLGSYSKLYMLKQKHQINNKKYKPSKLSQEIEGAYAPSIPSITIIQKNVGDIMDILKKISGLKTTSRKKPQLKSKIPDGLDNILDLMGSLLSLPMPENTPETQSFINFYEENTTTLNEWLDELDKKVAFDIIDDILSFLDKNNELIKKIADKIDMLMDQGKHSFEERDLLFSLTQQKQNPNLPKHEKPSLILAKKITTLEEAQEIVFGDIMDRNIKKITAIIKEINTIYANRTRNAYENQLTFILASLDPKLEQNSEDTIAIMIGLNQYIRHLSGKVTPGIKDEIKELSLSLNDQDKVDIKNYLKRIFYIFSRIAQAQKFIETHATSPIIKHNKSINDPFLFAMQKNIYSINALLSTIVTNISKTSEVSNELLSLPMPENEQKLQDFLPEYQTKKHNLKSGLNQLMSSYQKINDDAQRRSLLQPIYSIYPLLTKNDDLIEQQAPTAVKHKLTHAQESSVTQKTKKSKTSPNPQTKHVLENANAPTLKKQKRQSLAASETMPAQPQAPQHAKRELRS